MRERGPTGEQLCLPGQCGFSSTVEGNELTLDQEKAKLALSVETAAEAWGWALARIGTEISGRAGF